MFTLLRNMDSRHFTLKISTFSLFALTLAGCGGSTTDPCAGQTGVCIVAQVKGTATGLDQLRITASDPTTKTVFSPVSPAPFSLPVQIGLLFPTGTTGTLTIAMDGLSSGREVAHDSQMVAVTSGHNTATFTLNTGTAVNDMAMAPDLTVVPISVQVETNPDGGTPTPAPILTGYELEAIPFLITANDPEKKALTVNATGVPQTTITAGPPPLAVTITTDYKGAGMYSAMATATTTDSRNAAETFNINIINSIDPVFPLGDTTGSPNIFLAGSILGDFDGDSFADVASCSVSTTGGNLGKYTVNILFGAATGLPTTQPLLTDPRVQTYTFSGLGSLTTTPAARIPCKGGDFDGDGNSDVLLFDPLATPGGNTQGAFYVLFGQPRATTTSSVVALLDPTMVPAAGASIGVDYSAFVVGDFTGAGRTAVGFLTTGGATTTLYIYTFTFTGTFAHPPPGTPAILGTPTTTLTKIPYAVGPCSNPQLRGFHALEPNGSSKLDLVLWDPLTSCQTAKPPGGLVVYRPGASPSPITFAGPSPMPNTFGKLLSDVCDVDSDGIGDIVMGDSGVGGPVDIWFGTKSTFGAYPKAPDGTLDHSQAVHMAVPPNESYDVALCPANFNGGARSLMLGSTRVASGTHIDAFTSSRNPTLLRTLPNPGVPSFASSVGLGSTLDIFGSQGDVNGDGAFDVVISVGNNTGPDWLIYGR